MTEDRGPLLYEESDAVARITLNRPEVHNALSIQLSDELIGALEKVRASRSVKFLVIRGAGESFCVGDDITEMPTWGDANDVMRRVKLYQGMAYALEELDKITMAAVDGYAVGGGLEITMACDFVVATERAIWGMPEVDSGITPGWGGTTRMARLIGRRMTKEINLLGALHPARRAVELGLWNRVVPDGEIEAEVDRLLEVLASKDQQVLPPAQADHQQERGGRPLHGAGVRAAVGRALGSRERRVAGGGLGRRPGCHGVRREG